jgi:hypothetical protein
MQVWLHPNDVTQYKEIIYSIYIDKFFQKNQPVFSVLAKDGLPIVKDHQSGVKESGRHELFPAEIYKALQTMMPISSKTPLVGEKQQLVSADPAKSEAIHSTLHKLLEHFETINNILADPGLQPGDCDQIIVHLSQIEQSWHAFGELVLNHRNHNAEFAPAMNKFRPLRYSLVQWIRDFRTAVSQFRSKCPPVQPADQQQRERIYVSSLQPLNHLRDFETTLPPTHPN